MRYLAGVLAVGVMLVSGVGAEQAPPGETWRWFKGNTHTHTLNSDGDSTPEEVVRWYREQRYHFLFLTDHNFVTPVDALNGVAGAADRFLVIHGEEVTDSAASKPVHLNLLGGDGFVKPQGGATPAEALARDIAAMTAARGVIQVNHPNFGWALTLEDLKAGKGAHLLEIFNGHPQVNNLGGGGHPSVEAMWDGLWSEGLTVFGVASDDMHELKRPWVKASARPGQGWVMVRAARLTTDAILAGLSKGDFYASTGVELSDVQSTASSLTVTVKEQSFAKYTIVFIGRGGRVLKEATASPARYDFTGGEGYVRAKVIDSNGPVAWTQPVRVSR